MGQSALTVIVPIKPTDLAPLRDILTEIGQHIKDNSHHLYLTESPSTHFARWVILDAESKRPRLLFTSNYDGPFDRYMGELVTRLGASMEPIWSKCEGYSPGASQDIRRFTRFIQQHSLPCQTFYVAFPGVGVESIAHCSRIRGMIDRLLDAKQTGPWLKELTALLPPASQAGASPKQNAASSTPGELPLATRIVEWLVGIRPGLNPVRRVSAPPEQVAMEDIVVQNQMTVIVPIKPCLRAQLLLRAVLSVVSAQARSSFGALSNLHTIHFARWAIIDNGRNLLFESNYDGSWERYIDDFVDYASVGMNAIWANCVGFPTGGCRDIEWFKTYIRDHQIPAQVFYSAYPDATVKNILNDLQISGAVGQFLQREEVQEFFSGAYSSPPVLSAAKFFQEREERSPAGPKRLFLTFSFLSLLCFLGFFVAARRSSRGD